MQPTVAALKENKSTDPKLRKSTTGLIFLDDHYKTLHEETLLPVRRVDTASSSMSTTLQFTTLSVLFL